MKLSLITKKKVTIIPNFIAYPVFYIIRKLANKFKFLKVLYSIQSLMITTIIRTDCNLIPDKKFLKKGDDFLKSINVPDNAKIICLIVEKMNI